MGRGCAGDISATFGHLGDIWADQDKNLQKAIEARPQGTVVVWSGWAAPTDTDPGGQVLFVDPASPGRPD